MAETKTIENRDIKTLGFDPDNPRLPKSLDASDEQAVIKWMLRDATIIELMGAIGEHGYFPGEPLLTAGNTDATNWIVVEGNRRGPPSNC